MKINANFEQRAVVHAASLDWVNSPIPGVDRRPLDRVGGEVARATTIVRYAPNSKFSPHVHRGGEEFLVLEGVFQDEHGDFPEGSYIRNPPQSKHTPGSEKGCVIFVKLWQFQPEDRTDVKQQLDKIETIEYQKFTGVSITPLFEDKFEEVSILHFIPGAELSMNIEGGAELLILSGELQEQNDLLVKHSWLRLPIGASIQAKAGIKGAKVWIKTGHLIDVENQLKRVQNN